MERCGEDDFRVCDLAIAPRTLTAVAFPLDVTYLRVEQCILAAVVSEGDSVGSEEEEDAEELWECLRDPLPAEYYGATVHHASAASPGSNSAGTSSISAVTSSSSRTSHWPSSVDVNYSVAAFCEKVTLSAALYTTILFGVDQHCHWFALAPIEASLGRIFARFHGLGVGIRGERGIGEACQCFLGGGNHQAIA